MEAFKGRLAPDRNRSDRAKPQAGFTARRTCRAVGKPELSEPIVYSLKICVAKLWWIVLVEPRKIIEQKLPRG